MRLILAAAFLGWSCPLVFAALPSGIAGTWRGTFNGQPVDVKPDGSYPETVTRFDLKLMVERGRLSGVLRVTGPYKRTTPIQHTQCDPEGCGFEVVDNNDGDVNTWRVEAHGDKLIGSRNRGRMTPLGIGTGARFFQIKARRVPDSPISNQL
jgi:hypothetical protein